MGRSSTTRVVDNVGSGPRPMNQALISGIGGLTDDPVNEHTHFATRLRGGQPVRQARKHAGQRLCQFGEHSVLESSKVPVQGQLWGVAT